MCGVELVHVERLKPADYNPRRADAERLALVRLSLSRLGFLLPIVATPDGEILSGHQRHAVAMSMGGASGSRDVRGHPAGAAARPEHPF